MSNDQGKDPEFDELDLPSEDLSHLEPADETLDFDGVGEVLEPADDVAEGAHEGFPHEGSDALVEPLEPAEGETPPDLGWAGPSEVEDVTVEPSDEEPEEEIEQQPGFLQKLAMTSPYIVLLGISLAAILIGIFCLFMELKSYEFEIKPAQAKAAPAVLMRTARARDHAHANRLTWMEDGGPMEE